MAAATAVMKQSRLGKIICIIAHTATPRKYAARTNGTAAVPMLPDVASMSAVTAIDDINGATTTTIGGQDRRDRRKPSRYGLVRSIEPIIALLLAS